MGLADQTYHMSDSLLSCLKLKGGIFGIYVHKVDLRCVLLCCGIMDSILSVAPTPTTECISNCVSKKDFLICTQAQHPLSWWIYLFARLRKAGWLAGTSTTRTSTGVSLYHFDLIVVW